MKPVIFALLLVLVVSYSEALRCNCGGRTQCSSGVQTCYGPDQVCASFMFKSPASGFFKSCYRVEDCLMLSYSAVASGYCCSTDLCN